MDILKMEFDPKRNLLLGAGNYNVEVVEVFKEIKSKGDYEYQRAVAVLECPAGEMYYYMRVTSYMRFEDLDKKTKVKATMAEDGTALLDGKPIEDEKKSKKNIRAIERFIEACGLTKRSKIPMTVGQSLNVTIEEKDGGKFVTEVSRVKEQFGDVQVD